ncbi:MAG: hypothetical protein HC824_18385 [Synechococcales cyanobacterium RM1_1_8]|nr:hypothetical protein [Synechococcales cyanobacterium RM1_1_8]
MLDAALLFANRLLSATHGPDHAHLCRYGLPVMFVQLLIAAIYLVGRFLWIASPQT